MARRQKILIVDDRPENLFALKKIVSRTGAEIIEASSGNEALIASLNHCFAVAILDVQMPAMSGYELAEFLRKDAKTTHLPIIFLSAVHYDDSHIFRGYEAGAVDFITKPFDPRILIGKVSVFLELDMQRALLHNAKNELEKRVQERTAELRRAYSELEQHAAQLAAVNEDLRQFAFVASHDLQEPLRKIQTFGDILIKRHAAGLDKTGTEHLGRIVNSASRMRQLLDDLLKYCRVTTSSEPLKLLDLGKIANEAADFFANRIKAAGGAITITELPVIEADEIQMLQLFQNLIGNACKFRSSKRPYIRIYSELQADTVRILVEDNGIGFEEKYRDRIFGPFQRLHDRGEYQGTGMGLAICKKIVERHGGTITVRSRPGHGTRFIITLPVSRLGEGFTTSTVTASDGSQAGLIFPDEAFEGQ
ncbi:MAG: ATP-binding protein [Syntrophobacteraceae bacterium]